MTTESLAHKQIRLNAQKQAMTCATRSSKHPGLHKEAKASLKEHAKRLRQAIKDTKADIKQQQQTLNQETFNDATEQQPSK